MNEFYTNIQKKGNYLLLRGYRDGKSFKTKIQYKPYLFLPSKNKNITKYKSIYDESLDKIEFDSMSEASKFLYMYKDVEGMKIYGLNKFIYTYINDTYKIIDYNTSYIKPIIIDIEVDSKGGYSSPSHATKEVIAITIEYNDIYFIFGCGEYKEKFTNHKYMKCIDEKDLLIKFILFLEKISPDLISGWNCKLYDIPYLVNRIKNVLDDSWANRLSPWGYLITHEIEYKGEIYTTYEPAGISSIDYLDLYRKFTLQIHGQLESYSLNYVSHFEFEDKKIDYSQYKNLQSLYENNYDLFIDYNIKDVELVKRIEKRYNFFGLVYAMAYAAKINFSDTLQSVHPWDIIIHNELMKDNIIIPPYQKRIQSLIDGGYVKDPLLGLHEGVVSVDLTSLYPHLIMQYNISPETFVKKIPEKSIEYIIEHKYNDVKDILKDNLTITANYALFNKKKKGFLPILMERRFKSRSEYKKKMLYAEEQYNKTNDDYWLNEKTKYNNFQMAEKIFLNSCYGAIANIGCRYYSKDLAEGITLSGRLSVKWIAKYINDYLNTKFKTNNKDYIIAIDTDSVYMKLDKYITDKTKIVEELKFACDNEIQKVINDGYKELAIVSNAYVQAMHMKREVIADKAIWVKKKRYILNILDKEDINYNPSKIVIKGLEAVRSNTPELCRKAMKDGIKLILTKDELSVIKFIEEFKDNYKKLSVEDLALPKGINGLEKYYDHKNIWGYKCPIHVKGALIYNHLLSEYKINDKYDFISNGDKIKWIYLKEPNIIGFPVISFKEFLPIEFGLEKYIDYDKMFEKSFLDGFSSILEVIGWNSKEQSTLLSFLE